MAPSSSSRRCCWRRMWPSSTVSRVPRTLTSPSIAWGTPGIRVATRRGRISRTIPAGAAQISAPMRKMTAWSVGESAISIEEKKIAKGVRASNQVFATHCNKCRPQIGRPFGVEFKWYAGRGMAECQSRRVQCLTRGRSLQRLGGLSSHARNAPATPTGVNGVAHHRVANVLEMDPNLVGPPGMQLQPEQLGNLVPADHDGVGPGRAPGGGHRHALAVRRVARDGGLDDRGRLIQMTPG